MNAFSALNAAASYFYWRPGRHQEGEKYSGRPPCRSWFICRESAEFDIYREDLPFGRFRGKMWYDF
jgi:hypothetical protein